MDVDIGQIGQDLIKSIRGRRSSKSVSTRLGFRSNQVYKWETGRASVSWKQFLDFAEICSPEFLKRLVEFFEIHSALDDIPALIGFLCGDVGQNKLARKLGISRYTFARWMSGKATPSLTDILQMIASSGGQLITFLSQWGGFANFPRWNTVFEQDRIEVDILARYPYIAALMMAFDMESYKNSNSSEIETLSELSRISPAMMKKILPSLVAQGAVIPVNGLYQMRNPKVCVGKSNQIKNAVCLHWNQRVMQALPKARRQDDYRSERFDVFTINAKDYGELLELQRRFLHAIGLLIKRSNQGPVDKSFVLTMNLIDFEDLDYIEK